MWSHYPRKLLRGAGKSQVIPIPFLKNKDKPLVCFKAIICLNCSGRPPWSALQLLKELEVPERKGEKRCDTYYENILYVFRRHFLEEMWFGCNKQALVCLPCCAVLNVPFFAKYVFWVYRMSALQITFYRIWKYGLVWLLYNIECVSLILYFLLSKILHCVGVFWCIFLTGS